MKGDWEFDAITWRWPWSCERYGHMWSLGEIRCYHCPARVYEA